MLEPAMPGFPQGDPVACLSPVPPGHGRFGLPAAHHLAVRGEQLPVPLGDDVDGAVDHTLELGGGQSLVPPVASWLVEA